MIGNQLFLFDVSPPPDGKRRHWVCELIPGVGSSSTGEFAVRITPPMASGGVEYDELMLRAREDYAIVSADLSSVDLGAIGLVDVYINPLSGGSDTFEPFVGLLSDHLPEYERHGGFWQWFIDAMRAFVSREGHSSVPRRHVELGLELGRYVEKLRTEQRYGTLPDEKREYLESLPGWTWN